MGTVSFMDYFARHGQPFRSTHQLFCRRHLFSNRMRSCACTGSFTIIYSLVIVLVFTIRSRLSSPPLLVRAPRPVNDPGAGWALVVDGAVFLASEEIKPCFAHEYGRPGRDPEELVDYFTCGQCQLNWVCASCAALCHRNCRDVRPFSLNHTPTWACCYCSKKKAKSGCKLANRVKAAGAARQGK